MRRFRPLSSAFRRLPPVARRDRRITDLQARLAARHEAAARVPSFQAQVFAERRMRRHERRLDAPSPSVISRGKFWVYDLIRSHGVDVPEQLGRWADPGDIPFADLPDRVVIKSARGSAAEGVFPLRRTAEGWQIATHDNVLTVDALVAELRNRVERGRIRGPFGAEEFLDAGAPDELPTDVKIYVFYGEVHLVLVTRVHHHGDLSAIRYRAMDVHGTDLIDTNSHPALAGTAAADLDPALALVDLSLPTPKHLDDLVEVATQLSIAMRLPFARMDLYWVGDRVVFGEVTPRPGGRQWFGVELDARLGEAWERAQARLARDVANGVSREPQMGPHDVRTSEIDSPGLPR